MEAVSFKEATDKLFRAVTAPELAAVLGVIRSRIDKARIADGVASQTPAPEGWKLGVIQVAGARIKELEALIRAVGAEIIEDDYRLKIPALTDSDLHRCSKETIAVIRRTGLAPYLLTIVGDENKD